MQMWTAEEIADLVPETDLRGPTLLWVVQEPDFYRNTTSQDFALALLEARRELRTTKTS